jgi:glycosyltransferase involved in cell wall biosynthesis
MKSNALGEVLMLCPHGYTGLSYYVYSLCRSLSEQGTAVRLITSDPWIPTRHETAFPIEQLYTGASGARAKWRKGIHYLQSIYRVRAAVRQHTGQCVHLQISELPPVDAWLMRQCRRMGKRVIFTPHDIVHTKHYPGGRLLLQSCFDEADLIILHNQRNREELLQSYKIDPLRLIVIPHGNYAYFVDPGQTSEAAREILALDAGKQWLLFLGDLRPGKGLEVLCKALPLIVGQYPNTRLLIAGRLSHGLERSWLTKLLERSGALKWTECRLGFVPDEHVAHYYRSASLVMLPYDTISESGVMRYAHSVGAIPVCSDLTEFKETIKDGVNGYLFRQGDCVDLARCVMHALSEGARSKMKEAIRKTDQRYGWNSIAAQTSAAYERVVGA